jgi:tRNA C32,U32 (ribose-2'-O)-methylase TrmJ
MQEVLHRIGFLHGSHPDRMMGYFRRFFARHGLKSRDVKVFLGVFRQIEWYITRYVADDSLPRTNGNNQSPDPGRSSPVPPLSNPTDAD